MEINCRLSEWQKKFVVDKFDDELAIACTGISSGKSYALALWIVLQCMKKPGLRGIVIAQTFRSLQLVLIREIKNRAATFGIPIEHNKSNNEIKFANGSILYGFSAESPDSILGLTEIDLLAIDEAAYCNEEIYNNAKDRMRGNKYNCVTRLISSPSNTRVMNWFSKLCKDNADRIVRATALSNPFTTDEFKQELKERYGEGSTLYRQQVLGEIFDADVSSQIIFRHEFPLTKQGSDTTYYLGYDAAGLGADKDEIVVIDKFGMVDYKEVLEGTTLYKVDVINELKNQYQFKAGCADGTGGYSTGVTDVLKSKDIDIEPINFAQKAFDPDKYPNARTEMYIELAQAIRSGFWVNDIVKEEMIAQSVTINGKGQQQLLPKEDVKEILGHSPDLCDAVALALYAKNHSIVNTNKEYDNVVQDYLYKVGYYG